MNTGVLLVENLLNICSESLRVRLRELSNSKIFPIAGGLAV